jgi:hypothetical protein
MENLETRFWATAVGNAREAGMTYTVPCSRNVRDLIRAGAAVMLRSGRTGEGDLELADAHLSRLTAEMVRLTRMMGEAPAEGTGKINIRETALVGAKELCPLWPFG